MHNKVIQQINFKNFSKDTWQLTLLTDIAKSNYLNDRSVRINYTIIELNKFFHYIGTLNLNIRRHIFFFPPYYKVKKFYIYHDGKKRFFHLVLSGVFQLKGYKVTDVNRIRKVGVACRSLQELKRKACAKLNVSIVKWLTLPAFI